MNMHYLLLRNVKRISSCNFFHTVVMKQHFPAIKPNYLEDRISIHLSQSRTFSLIGFYSAVSQSTPVVSLQHLLIELHQISGLPWWSLIMLTTLGIRTIIVLPLTIHQNQVIARLANINSGMGKLAEELNKEVNMAQKMYNWSVEDSKKVFRRQMKKLHDDLVVKNNCHPAKTLMLVMIQVPVWMCFSISLRNITMLSNAAYSNVNSLNLNLKTEGILWFTDLTCPDPVFIPLILMFVNLTLIEIHALRQIGKGSLLQKILLNGSRIITVVVAVAASISPTTVTWYWLCSSTFGIGQSLVLMNPRVRNFVRIPTTGKESTTPYADIAKNFRKRFLRR